MKEQKNLKERALEEEQELNDRINKLYGNSKIEKHTELTDEQRKKIKKDIVMLIWLIVIVFAIMVAGLFVSFDKPKKVIENNNSQEEKPKVEILPDGDLDITNEIVLKIDKLFDFNPENPLYEDNILKIYDANVKVNELDFQAKMLLLTSNARFNEYLFSVTKLKEYNPNKEYNVAVKLTKEQLETIAYEIFDEDFSLEHQDFKYYYKYSEDKNVYFNVKLNGDEYTFEPTEGNISGFLVHQKLVKAHKINDFIYFGYYVLFEQNEILYSDSTMLNEVSKDIFNIDKYMNKGQYHEFIYQDFYDSYMLIDGTKLNLYEGDE